MLTENLIIRELNLDDTDSFFEIISDERVKDDVTPVKSKLEAMKFIESSIGNHRLFLFALISKQYKKLVGVISLSITDEMIGELGCVMHPNFWNKGYGSEAMKAVEQFAMEKIGLSKLASKCNLFNSSCAQLYKTVLNFDYIKTENVNGTDVLFFEKTKQDYYNKK